SPDSYLFGIFLKQDGRHVGNIKIGNIHPKHQFADIGIIIGDRDIWGQGFATEAIRLCVRFSFEELKLHKLFAGMVAGNEGSFRAFKKAGFGDSGHFRKHYWMDGEYRDAYIVELLNE
ncbi:MAG: GNAT family N-acetyltransferase, partial [Candidatus Omnitrophica bacterium]|nr:GNAT family N-acetyltransferase [Candidatus Omnitrophota bacterium]